MSALQSFSSVLVAAGVTASALLSGPAAVAADCYDCAIRFDQSGTVELTVLTDVGGFDHQLALDAGGSMGPLGGYGINMQGAQATFTVQAGTELIFALAGFLTDRIGGIGEDEFGSLAAVVYTGSAVGASTGVVPAPNGFMSYVEGLGTDTVTVHMSDLFAETSPYAPGTTFNQVAFSLQLTPAAVPEASTWALFGVGLLSLLAASRRRG